MRKLWLGGLVVAATFVAINAAHARKLAHSDILGAWCGDKSKYVFTRQALTVTWFGSADRRVLKVLGWNFSDTWVEVKWKPKGNTMFGNFRDNGRTMEQYPNTAGDMGPRRVFRRCK